MADSRFVYVTYIRTTPEALWKALIDPEFTRQYWAETWQECEWKPGASWRIMIPDGRVAGVTTTELAQQLGFRVGHGTSAPVEGAWPYAPIVEALADVCRQHPSLLDGLSDHHREEIDRALSGAEIEWTGESSHQRLFVAAAELVRVAAATHGLLLTIDDVHGADDATLRLVHYIARSTRDRGCSTSSCRTRT